MDLKLLVEDSEEEQGEESEEGQGQGPRQTTAL